MLFILGMSAEGYASGGPDQVRAVSDRCDTRYPSPPVRFAVAGGSVPGRESEVDHPAGAQG